MGDSQDTKEMIYTNPEKTQYFMKGKYGDTVSGTVTVKYQTIKFARLEASNVVRARLDTS